MMQNYCLFVDCLLTQTKQVPWSEVVSNIANMTDKMDNFAARCKKLPGRLKQWDAFTQLRLVSKCYLYVRTA